MAAVCLPSAPCSTSSKVNAALTSAPQLCWPSLQDLQSRASVTFAQRREVEDVLDEHVRVHSTEHRHLGHVDQLGGSPRQGPERRGCAGPSGPHTSLTKPSVCPLMWPRASSAKGARPTMAPPCSLDHLRLRQPDGRQLRDRIDADRHRSLAARRRPGLGHGAPPDGLAPWPTRRGRVGR